MSSSYSSHGASTKRFSLMQNAFLQADGLPFRDVLPEAEIQAAFAAESSIRKRRSPAVPAPLARGTGFAKHQDRPADGRPARERLPRELSFAAALAAVVAAWDHATAAAPVLLSSLAAMQLNVIAASRVGDRPNRVEPRAIKRRPKPHKLLTKPRAEARAELLAANGGGKAAK